MEVGSTLKQLQYCVGSAWTGASGGALEDQKMRPSVEGSTCAHVRACWTPLSRGWGRRTSPGTRELLKACTQENDTIKFDFKNSHSDCQLDKGLEADVRLEGGDALAR